MQGIVPEIGTRSGHSAWQPCNMLQALSPLQWLMCHHRHPSLGRPVTLGIIPMGGSTNDHPRGLWEETAVVTRKDPVQIRTSPSTSLVVSLEEQKALSPSVHQREGLAGQDGPVPLMGTCVRMRHLGRARGSSGRRTPDMMGIAFQPGLCQEQLLHCGAWLVGLCCAVVTMGCVENLLGLCKSRSMAMHTVTASVSSDPCGAGKVAGLGGEMCQWLAPQRHSPTSVGAALSAPAPGVPIAVPQPQGYPEMCAGIGSLWTMR